MDTLKRKLNSFVDDASALLNEKEATPSQNQQQQQQKMKKAKKIHANISLVDVCFDGESEAEEAALFLEKNGLVVIRNEYLTKNIACIRENFETDISEMPEFMLRSGSAPGSSYVRGGFSALGNASSWHMPTTRWLRCHAMRAVFPVFSALLRDQPNVNLAQLCDRAMFRPAGVKPPGDAWHRDIFPSLAPNETIYGGWISLDDKDQFLSCKMGTHRENNAWACNGMEGFAPIANETLLNDLKLNHDHIRIPSGCILIFNEKTFHEVLSRSLPYTSLRLFLAWMTTPQSDKCNPPNLDALLQTQAIIPLKSGQMPRMWPVLDGVYRTDSLEAWGAYNLQPCMLETVQRKDRLVTLPRKVAPSLQEAGLPMYPSYEEHEKSILHASRSHHLPTTVGSLDLSTFSL
jgi:hypothetical protein